MSRHLRLAAVLLAIAALAPAAFAASAPQPLPDRSQLDVFSAAAPRAFFVGSGRPAPAGTARVVAADNEPPIGCVTTRDFKCSQGTSQGHCTAYLNYFCDDCQCAKFQFP